MKRETKTLEILNDGGERVLAACPVILSVSRSTDIPAFYADWFFHRLEKGHMAWRNPYNHRISYISFSEVRLIVFWTKNAGPLLPHLKELDKRNIHYYFQYTLNDYEAENLEPNVPALTERLATFRLLSEHVGKERVIWRNDPLMLTDRLNVDRLLEKTAYIGEELMGYTEKLVFSFADIGIYRNVRANLSRSGVVYREFGQEDMLAWAEGIRRLNEKWGYDLASCAEKIDLSGYGILHNKCIDNELIVRLFSEDEQLMSYLEKGSSQKRKSSFTGKDNGQRSLCHCIPSKTVGEYNTCPHMCVYCYANHQSGQVLVNYRKHKENPEKELLI